MKAEVMSKPSPLIYTVSDDYRSLSSSCNFAPENEEKTVIKERGSTKGGVKLDLSQGGNCCLRLSELFSVSQLNERMNDCS